MTESRIWSNLAEVSLADEYKQQFHHRAWDDIFGALPDLNGRTILDLGCGIGDQGAELVARGATVIGLDGNEELLQAARARGLPNADFRLANLQEVLPVTERIDGIWCSFVAAYFIDFAAILQHWTQYLQPGGWIAVTEIDDLFGHEPLQPRSRGLLEGYVEDSLRTGRYDFRMGRKLRMHLQNAGFDIEQEFTAADREFSFAGAASADVLQGWQRRFERMKLLQLHCGAEFSAVQSDFLQCLGSPEHRSLAKVNCVVGTTKR